MVAAGLIGAFTGTLSGAIAGGLVEPAPDLGPRVVALEEFKGLATGLHEDYDTRLLAIENATPLTITETRIAAIETVNTTQGATISTHTS